MAQNLNAIGTGKEPMPQNMLGNPNATNKVKILLRSVCSRKDKYSPGLLHSSIRMLFFATQAGRTQICRK